MGILSAQDQRIWIQAVTLIKQEVSEVSVSLDMEWWADKQIEIYEQHGIEPWQSSVWIHSHPAGINRPSSTDQATMQESFGGWAFAIMLILTQDGQFYAQLDFDHEYPWGEKVRFNIKCDVCVDWSNTESVTEEDLKQWDVEFKTLVSEISGTRFDSRRRTKSTKENKSPARSGFWSEEEDLFDGKEDDAYVELCEQHNLDPYDPASYEAIYGFWPGPGDLEFAGVSSFTGWD